jgi:hypothetical protein
LCGTSRAVHQCFQVPAPLEDPAAYLDALISLIEREKVELVLPVSEEILHVAALHGRLPSSVRIASMPLDQLLSVHGKLSFIEGCTALGLQVPATCRLGTPAAKSLHQSGPVIIKREYSCAGVGLEKVPAGRALPERAKPDEWLVQQFIEGQEICSLTLAYEGRSLGTVVYRGRVVSGTVAVCFERIDPPAGVLAWVETFVAGGGLSGFIGLDLMLGPDGGVFGLECNPRATSGVHFFRPEDLAQALTDPAHSTPLRFRPERLLQQFYPCLTETQASLFQRSGFRDKLKYLLRARDVTFQRRDPLPFILLPISAWSILSRSLFQGMSFGEAATWDIEWRLPQETGK